mmetsp:Transcript_18553/g.55714  ORF Transcript_18553/g.55714 Transcript_18553/m.55714 type:complete len:200 (-) Transcript_18553:241-840(-)
MSPNLSQAPSASAAASTAPESSTERYFPEGARSSAVPAASSRISSKRSPKSARAAVALRAPPRSSVTNIPEALLRATLPSGCGTSSKRALAGGSSGGCGVSRRPSSCSPAPTLSTVPLQVAKATVPAAEAGGPAEAFRASGELQFQSSHWPTAKTKVSPPAALSISRHALLAVVSCPYRLRPKSSPPASRSRSWQPRPG